MRSSRYEIAPLLETLLLSKDFYSPASYATHIKGPVELVVSTYRKLGLTEIPGMPDFNEATTSLGQQLFGPPTVAGWAQGRSWITPGLLIERGNFALDVMFPDVTHLPADRYPIAPSGDEIRAVHQKIRAGLDIATATRPAGKDQRVGMAMSNEQADRDEDFNTRYGSYRGWQMAVERVKPITRTAARLDLTRMVTRQGCATTTSLTALDPGDNLVPTTDFRRVHATAMNGWLGVPDTKPVLRGEFQTFPVFG